MSKKWLSDTEWMEILNEKQYVDANNIGCQELKKLKLDGLLTIRVPKSTNQNIPYDTMCWSKTVKSENIRHEPRYVSMDIFNTKISTARCIRYEFKDVSKQVFSYKDHIYSHYVVIDDSFELPDPQNVKKRRLNDNEIDELRSKILPYRSVANAKVIARQKGMDVTTKQLFNLNRKNRNAETGRRGPRAATTIESIRNIGIEKPDQMTYFVDQCGHLQFTFFQAFPEAISLYLNGCPTEQELKEWKEKMDEILMLNEDDMMKELKFLLDSSPTSVFFLLDYQLTPHITSQIHTSQLFLGNWVILGYTKSSGKKRVIPLAYCMHTSRSTDVHRSFAAYLKKCFDSKQKTSEKRAIPMICMDGEKSLEQYSEALGTKAIRCEFHLYSLLKFLHGKKNVEAAKKMIFGIMVGKKWKRGLLGSFTEIEFDSKLSKIQGKVCDGIYNWLVSNRVMLIDSASARAKLLVGVVLQYQTNNSSENFNGLIKLDIKKHLSADKCIEKLDNICGEMARDCWLSILHYSEKVVFDRHVPDGDVDETVEFLTELGLRPALLLALEVTPEIAKDLDMKKSRLEEIKVKHQTIQYSDGEVYTLKDSRNSQKRFTQVELTNGTFICGTCGTTLPTFVCSHILICMSATDSHERPSRWNSMWMNSRAKIQPKPSVRSGKKLNDRIGSRTSANNHHRRVVDVSNLTIFGNSTDFEEDDSEDDIDSKDDMESEDDMGCNDGSEDETRSNDEMDSQDDINNNSRIDSNDGSDANGNPKSSHSYDLFYGNQSNAQTGLYDSPSSLRSKIAHRQKSYGDHPSDEMDDSMPSSSTDRRRSSRKRHQKRSFSPFQQASDDNSYYY